MLTFFPAAIRGIISTLFLVINTLLFCAPLLVVALFKALIPVKGFRTLCSHILNNIVSAWISTNSLIMRLCNPTIITSSGLSSLDSLDKTMSYLVTSNHQSWADIVLVQVLLNRRLPQLKFFLKQELIWVPVLGLCWWALDFPFMRRHTKEYLAKYPEKKGEDMKATRNACEKFRDTPVCIYNFAEGTRFSTAKHERQHSPYQYLLKPKSGGVGFVIGAMGNKMADIINITISYQHKTPSFWEFLCGHSPAVHVHVEVVKIPEHFTTRNYQEDRGYRAEIQRWMNDLWQEKDALMDKFKQEER